MNKQHAKNWVENTIDAFSQGDISVVGSARTNRFTVVNQPSEFGGELPKMTTVIFVDPDLDPELSKTVMTFAQEQELFICFSLMQTGLFDNYIAVGTFAGMPAFEIWQEEIEDPEEDDVNQDKTLTHITSDDAEDLLEELQAAWQDFLDGTADADTDD